jgi:hypothetical protein
MSRRGTSAHQMALNPTGRGNDASLSDEEAMATYYSIERGYAERDEERTNGTYSNDLRNSQKGYPKAGSSQNAYKYQCKYRNSLPRRPCSLHAVECKLTIIRWALWAFDLKITFITAYFGCLISQVTGISKYITSNGRSREWLMETESNPDIAPPSLSGCHSLWTEVPSCTLFNLPPPSVYRHELRWITVALYRGSTAVWNNALIQYYHGIMRWGSEKKA